MRKKLKTFRGTYKAGHSQARLWGDFIAPDRPAAVVVSRMLAPVRAGGACPPRRRLRRLPGLYWDAWREYLAQDAALRPTPAIPPIHWLKRAWRAILDALQRFWRPKPEPKRVMCPSKPWGLPRKGPKWELPGVCPLCGCLSYWKKENYSEWCGCHNERINNFRAAKT